MKKISWKQIIARLHKVILIEVVVLLSDEFAFLLQLASQDIPRQEFFDTKKNEEKALNNLKRQTLPVFFHTTFDDTASMSTFTLSREFLRTFSVHSSSIMDAKIYNII